MKKSSYKIEANPSAPVRPITPENNLGSVVLPRRFVLRALVLLIVVASVLLPLAGGCGPRPAVLADPTAPPTGYQRRIIVVAESRDFYPIAGAEILVEVEEPTLLISPIGGRGRTNSKGELELVFEPHPHYDRKVMAGGDIVADFPVRAKVTVGRAHTETINDTQTFARFADPLYQGLNRDPLTDATHHFITIP